MTATTPARAVQSAARLDPRTDAELVSQFLLHHDQPAFATLVQRHGPLVYGVCQRTLGATPDADDAFQATFLVLVKRARTIQWRANLGPWLFGVAHRVAAKARFQRARRFALEKQVDDMPHQEVPSTERPEVSDLGRMFDEELSKLPEEMRRAVVLCELQGLSRREAAAQLRVSEGTLSSRLGRARKKLAAAFAERGMKLAIPAAVSVSMSLATSTTQAAFDPAGPVPAEVNFLVQEALKVMTVSKLKVGVVLAVVAVGCSWMAFANEPKKSIARAIAKPDGKALPPATADKPMDAVATLNGKDISRAEFGEYLIQKYGAKEIELYVNRKLIQQEATKANVAVTEQEVDTELVADVKDIPVTKDDFTKIVLPKYGKTEAEWRQDVILPRLQLKKMLSPKVVVTDDDLRKLFERKYGEQRRFYFLRMEKLSPDSQDVPDFYQHPKPISRYVASDGDPTLVDAIFKMKVGETSDPIDTKQYRITVYLAEIIPPRADKKFDEEKANLVEEALKEKIQKTIPTHFETMKKESKVEYHLKPEPKAESRAVPAKK